MNAQAVTDVAILIADMVRAGVDPDIVGRTAAALSERRAIASPDAQAERRRAADRERKRLRNSAETAENPLPPDAPQGKVSPTPPSKPNPPLIPPAPASSSAGARRDLETELRTMMVTEPIVVATDFREIAKLLEEPGITEADAIEGVRAAMAEQSFRPKYWRQLVGWIRGAAKQRLANGEKGRPPVSASTEPRVELGAGISWPVSSVERAVATWRSNPGAWPYSALGPQPGSPGCRVPARFLTAEVA